MKGFLFCRFIWWTSISYFSTTNSSRPCCSIPWLTKNSFDSDSFVNSSDDGSDEMRFSRGHIEDRVEAESVFTVELWVGRWKQSVWSNKADIRQQRYRDNKAFELKIVRQYKRSSAISWPCNPIRWESLAEWRCILKGGVNDEQLSDASLFICRYKMRWMEYEAINHSCVSSVCIAIVHSFYGKFQTGHLYVQQFLALKQMYQDFAFLDWKRFALLWCHEIALQLDLWIY